MSETKTCPLGIISVNPYLTTYERHYQPADRKSQTGPLYKLIQFFKTFENKFLLFLWNAATCIRHRKESCPVICLFEFKHNRTFFSKLNSIHQQIYQHLPQIPGVTATETMISLEQSIKKEIPIQTGK